MMKTITAIFLAMLLTACSSSETEKTTTTFGEKDKKIESKESSKPKENLEQNSSVKQKSQKTVVSKPIMSIYTLDEKEIHVNETSQGLTFQEYKDKAVFIILFGYRCPPCLQEMPNLIAIMNKKYPDLEIIAIEVQGLNSEGLEEFKKRKGINYTLAVGSENNKFINYIASKAQWQGSIPFFLSFDKSGIVKVVHVGALSADQLEAVYKDSH